jgi:Ca2+-binding RTX toxin-like protein
MKKPGKAWAALGVVVFVLGLVSIARAHAVCPATWDHWHTGQGNDVVGTDINGSDCWFLGQGADSYTGQANDSYVNGEEDGDLLIGAGGEDWLVGGPAADELRGGTGRDELAGNGGNDEFHADTDLQRDTIFDGTGKDVVSGGPEDDLYRCEDGDADDFSDFHGTLWGPSTAFCSPAFEPQ